jgi:hypothetical protein
MITGIHVTYRLVGQATTRTTVVPVVDEVRERLAETLPSYDWSAGSLGTLFPPIPNSALRRGGDGETVLVDAGHVADKAAAQTQAIPLIVILVAAREAEIEGERRAKEARQAKWDEAARAVLDAPDPLACPEIKGEGALVERARARIVEARKARDKATEEARNAEEARQAEARAVYIAALPLTPNQRERQEAGVLPNAELEEAAREAEFGGVDLPRYDRIPDGEVPDCRCEAAEPALGWLTLTPEDLTAAEWEALMAVISAFAATRGAKVRVVHHRGTWCEGGIACSWVDRSAVRVKIATPIGVVVQDYAVPGEPDFMRTCND